MSRVQYITAHEPEEELLSAEDAWQDFLSLKQALSEEQLERVNLEVDPATKILVQDLVAAGVGANESEIVARAVQSFFAATYPKPRQRLRVLRESPEEP